MMLTPLLAEFTGWHYLYTAWLSLLSIFLILVAFLAAILFEQLQK